MIEMPTTPGTRTVANETHAPCRRLRRPLANRGEHVQEDEDEQKGLHERANDELEEVLLQHDEVALDQREQRLRLAAKLERVGSIVNAPGIRPGTVLSRTPVAVISREAPYR